MSIGQISRNLSKIFLKYPEELIPSKYEISVQKFLTFRLTYFFILCKALIRPLLNSQHWISSTNLVFLRDAEEH